MQGEAAGLGGRGAPGGVLPLPGVGLPPPPFHVGLGEEGGRGGGEEGRGGGRRPPLLVLFGLGGRGVRPCPGLLSSLPPRPNKAH